MNRERITISIKKDLLSKVDKKVDGVKLRNRSHAVESLLSEALGINAIKDAIVMAGGEEATKNIAAIKKALADGTIDCISSDYAPIPRPRGTGFASFATDKRRGMPRVEFRGRKIYLSVQVAWNRL